MENLDELNKEEIKIESNENEFDLEDKSPEDIFKEDFENKLYLFENNISILEKLSLLSNPCRLNKFYEAEELYGEQIPVLNQIDYEYREKDPELIREEIKSTEEKLILNQENTKLLIDSVEKLIKEIANNEFDSNKEIKKYNLILEKIADLYEQIQKSIAEELNFNLNISIAKQNYSLKSYKKVECNSRNDLWENDRKNRKKLKEFRKNIFILYQYIRRKSKQ
jgi:hypothetical protein